MPCHRAVNAFNLWTEHWEYWEHLPPLEERTEYPYQNLRIKDYFSGDGDKVSPSMWKDKETWLMMFGSQTLM